MKKYLFGLTAFLIAVASVAFTIPEKKKMVSKTFRYTVADNSEVFNAVYPHWEETSPTYDCDPIDPELPCTVTIETDGDGYEELDEFLQLYINDLVSLMSQPNVTGKDE
jgi:hypothetical protein